MNIVQSTYTHKAHVKTKINKKINKIIFNFVIIMFMFIIIMFIIMFIISIHCVFNRLVYLTVHGEVVLVGLDADSWTGSSPRSLCSCSVFILARC